MDALLHLHPWRYSYERVSVNNPIATDPIKQVYPRRVLANQMIGQGAWPLWNPTVLAGTPLLPDGQLTLFYPPSVLFLLLPLAQAYGWYAFLQVMLAGAGTFLFARRIGLGRGAATLAGAAYMLNGYMLTWLPFPHHTGATAMVPWCFWAAEWAIGGGRWRRWPLAGAVLALPLVSHLQVAFYAYLCVGCYVLLRAAQLRDWRPAAGLALAGVCALGLGAAQLLPSVQLSSQGQRADLGVQPGSAQEQFMALLRLLLPSTGGSARVGDAPAWGAQLLQAPQPYAGLLVLALVLVALARSRHSAAAFFGVLAAAAFAMAVRTPLLQLFAALVPPYRQFEDHTRWFVVWGFAVAVLAAMGAQSLFERSRTRSAGLLVNRALLLGGGAALLGWAMLHLQLFTPASRYGQYITAVRQQPLLPTLLLGVASAAALGLLVAAARTGLRSLALAGWPVAAAVLAVDLVWNGGGYATTFDLGQVRPTADLSAALAQEGGAAQDAGLLYPPTRQVDFLLRQPGPFRIHGGDYEVLPPNFSSTYGLEDVRGYVSLYSARYNQLVRLIDGKDYRHTGDEDIAFRAYLTSAYKHRRLLDMLNVRYILFTPGSQNVALYQPLELVQQSDEGAIYRNPNALPRAWLVHRVEHLPDDIAQLDRMASADFDPASLAVVAEAAPAVQPAAAAEAAPVVSYAPNQVRILATASSAALLVLADSYADGWDVTVDGQPAALYRTNYTLRGVWLPAGEHTVEMRYQPRSFTLGLAISGGTLLVVLAVALWAARVRRRGRA
ncbi:YfhO family protein [Chloroflexia bacterium SDU3-3]|nr:YfhO family protein [Chloroflexia bacterium SDU3-3]